MSAHEELVYSVLRDPSVLGELPATEWDQLLRRARRAGVLSRVAVMSQRVLTDNSLPEKARDHLFAALLVAAHHERTLRWEVNRIRHALESTCERIVLLKGAAYALAELPAGIGRLASDVDILLPKAELEAAEEALLQAGWTAMKLDPYDQRYYRTWMHELPPLRHETRNTVVDVHHTILPETARYHPDANKLLEDIVLLDGNLAVLAPVDMILHSATHLFADGDLAGGLREVIDLDVLFRHFADAEPGFWTKLVPRADELDLQRPLFYALRYCSRLLGTPVPDEVTRAMESRRPTRLTAALMDALTTRALLPDTEGSSSADMALWILYVRSHWMRMPPFLLTRHLTRKALRRWFGSSGT